jgi:hypothetical protein
LPGNIKGDAAMMQKAAGDVFFWFFGKWA